jgi:hypothetical protein
MPQIFHPSLNTISRVGVFGLVFVPLAAVGLATSIVRSPYQTEQGIVRNQPVPFSHEHHVGDAGIDCRYCHETVETSAFAGIPSTEVCMGCHSELWRDSPMLAPVRDSLRSGTPIEWTRVHDLPEFVYFNHSIHVHKGVACEKCHGRVDKMPMMYREASLLMSWCVDCHRDPSHGLRGGEAVFAMGDAIDESTHTKGVESKTDCSYCHR